MGRYAVVNQTIINPVKTVYVAESKDSVKDYIIKVFGKDAPKAFKLLECENRSLDPNAVSKTNDYGLFQISAYWQQVQPKFLLNPYVNTLIAHQLYVENGNSFKLWSCGKMLKI